MKIQNKEELQQAIDAAQAEAYLEVSNMKRPKKTDFDERVHGYTAFILFQKHFPQIHSFNWWHHRYDDIDYFSGTRGWKYKDSPRLSGRVDLYEFITEITQLV